VYQAAIEVPDPFYEFVSAYQYEAEKAPEHRAEKLRQNRDSHGHAKPVRNHFPAVAGNEVAFYAGF
jgi:hypothetical protein